MALNYKLTSEMLDKKSEYRENVANNIKYLRIHNGLTQSDVARVLNVSRSNIAKYESNACNISWYLLILLSILFRVSVEDMVFTNIRYN